VCMTGCARSPGVGRRHRWPKHSATDWSLVCDVVCGVTYSVAYSSSVEAVTYVYRQHMDMRIDTLPVRPTVYTYAVSYREVYPYGVSIWCRCNDVPCGAGGGREWVSERASVLSKATLPVRIHPVYVRRSLQGGVF
jgi:hypothetical protein